jgi:hypothetical protein
LEKKYTVQKISREQKKMEIMDKKINDAKAKSIDRNGQNNAINTD